MCSRRCSRAGVPSRESLGRARLSPAHQRELGFTQKLLLEIGDQNRYTQSISALKATLVGDLALVLSYTIKHNSDVLPGIEKTDTFTAISLEYGF